MIYYLFYELLYNHLKDGESYLVKALNVFQYVTFRTAYASITALLISLLFGGRVIRALKGWNVGQQRGQERRDRSIGRAKRHILKNVQRLTRYDSPSFKWL